MSPAIKNWIRLLKGRLTTAREPNHNVCELILGWYQQVFLAEIIANNSIRNRGVCQTIGTVITSLRLKAVNSAAVK
jgi:hypothetical protein